MDRKQLCESLMTWLQTFDIDGRRTSVHELADGVAMSQVLNKIAPTFFTTAWMSKIKKEVSDNWRLKVSNLKKILTGILDYYSEVLGQTIQDFQMPDVQAIGEHNDPTELGRMLQLILGCAVNCDEKQEYIQKIMSMEESVQLLVMQAIQELMTKEAPAGSGETSEVAEQLKKTLEDLNSVTEQKEEIAQRCHELDLQVAALQEERDGLVSENDRLSERLNQADSLDDLSTPAGRRYQQLQSQVEQLQEDLYRLETARDDYRIKVELQEKEILELHQKNEELSSLAEEARTLKDEMDIFRDTQLKVTKYESTIEMYKKKLEELSDLKGQVKLMEEKNTAYMETNMELDEELRKMQPLKSQVEAYKKQVQELQAKCTEETKRADKAEFESNRHQEKMQAALREKERLVAERDSLQEANEELRCSQAREDSMGEGGGIGSPGVELMSLPPHAREMIIRLQHEVKMLKLQSADNETQQGQVLQSMLDDANARKSELESDVRIANQRILELKAQIEDLQEKSSAAADDGSAGLRAKLKEQIQKCRDLDGQLKTKQVLIEEELEPNVQKSKQQVKELEEQLNKKEEDMKMMEERYKRYLEKAKSVIRTLDPGKHTPGASPDVQALRTQLQDKERLIEHLERDHDKAKTIREQEEKLIVTAWYNLGMQLHRKAAEDRLSNSGAGQSFLARQRQAHIRRTQSSAAHNAGNR